jgi:hypothetical protein
MRAGPACQLPIAAWDTGASVVRCRVRRQERRSERRKKIEQNQRLGRQGPTGPLLSLNPEPGCQPASRRRSEHWPNLLGTYVYGDDVSNEDECRPAGNSGGTGGARSRSEVGFPRRCTTGTNSAAFEAFAAVESTRDFDTSARSAARSRKPTHGMNRLSFSRVRKAPGRSPDP